MHLCLKYLDPNDEITSEKADIFSCATCVPKKMAMLITQNEITQHKVDKLP